MTRVVEVVPEPFLVRVDDVLVPPHAAARELSFSRATRSHPSHCRVQLAPHETELLTMERRHPLFFCDISQISVANVPNHSGKGGERPWKHRRHSTSL